MNFEWQADALHLRVICRDNWSGQMTATLKFGQSLELFEPSTRKSKGFRKTMQASSRWDPAGEIGKIQLMPLESSKVTGVWLGSVDLKGHPMFKVTRYGGLCNASGEDLRIKINESEDMMPVSIRKDHTASFKAFKACIPKDLNIIITVHLTAREYYCSLAGNVKLHFRAELAELSEQSQTAAYVVGDCPELGRWKPLESNRLNFEDSCPGVGHCKVKILAAFDGESLTSIERPGEPLMVQLYTGKSSEHRMELRFESMYRYLNLYESFPQFFKPELVVAMTDNRVLYCGVAAEVQLHFRAELAELSEQSQTAAYMVGDCPELGRWKPLESNRLNFEDSCPGVGHCKVKILAVFDGESLTSIERPGKPLMVQLYTGKSSEQRMSFSLRLSQDLPSIMSSACNFFVSALFVRMTEKEILHFGPCCVFPLQALIRSKLSRPLSFKFNPESALSHFESSYDAVWICRANLPQRLVGTNNPLLTKKDQELQTEIEITRKMEVAMKAEAEASEVTLSDSVCTECKFHSKIAIGIPINMVLIDVSIDEDVKCFKVINIILHFRLALSKNWKDNNRVFIVGNWGFKNPQKELQLKREHSFCKRHSAERSDAECRSCSTYLKNSAAVSVAVQQNMLLKSAHLCDIQFTLKTEVDSSTQVAQPENSHKLHLSVDRGMNIAEFDVNLHENGLPDVRIAMFDFKIEKIFLDFANFLGNIRGLSSSRSNLANVRRIYAEMLVPDVSADGSYVCCEAGNPQMFFDIWGQDPSEEKEEEFLIPKSSVTYCQLRQMKFPNVQNARNAVADRLRARYTERENEIFRCLKGIIQSHSEFRDVLTESKSASSSTVFEQKIYFPHLDRKLDENFKELRRTSGASTSELIYQPAVDEILSSIEVLQRGNCSESPKFAGSLIKVANRLNDLLAGKNIRSYEVRLLLRHSAAIVRGRLEEKLLMDEIMQNCIVTKAWFAFMMAVWNTIQPQELEPEKEKKKFRHKLQGNYRVPAFYTWRINECPRED